ARLRELTGATRQVLTTRVDRALGDQQPATNPAMPAELAGGRVTAAWQQDADARTAVTTATGRLADAIIVARETRVPWRAITAATGTSREAVIAMVRRTQADQAGDTQPIWEGTSPPPADREPAGPWRWPSVRDAVAAAPARVGDQLRRRMLADGAPPARILAAVSDARTAAHTAAVGAVDTGEPDDPEQLVTAVWKAAAAHSIDASL
ncbi:MAG: hypothetical protein L0H59_17635, partial [Tomitella sp.]|nr:hypothetical protein [Tomitella sp.]